MLIEYYYESLHILYNRQTATLLRFCLVVIFLLRYFLFAHVLFVSSSSDLNGTNYDSVSLQDVVNVVGGLGVLLPLLEQVCEAEPVYNGGQETSDLLGPELTSSRGPAAMLLPLNKSAGEAIFIYYFF